MPITSYSPRWASELQSVPFGPIKYHETVINALEDESEQVWEMCKYVYMKYFLFPSPPVLLEILYVSFLFTIDLKSKALKYKVTCMRV